MLSVNSLKLRGVKMQKLTKQEIAEIRKCYLQYNSVKAVAKMCKRSPNTVNKYVSSCFRVRKLNIVNKILSADERLVGTYIGLWMGDGTQYRDRWNYRVKICSNKEDQLLNEFIQQIILRLFGKTSALIKEKKTNRAYIKFSSKYISEYVKNYVTCEKNKTTTVRLSSEIESYGPSFLEGCLLGLALSDGYLKEKFLFNVTSPGLADNMMNLLTYFGFKPSIYIHKRKKYGWHDLYMVHLRSKESVALGSKLDETLQKLNSYYRFKKLKYGPAEI